MAKTNKTLEDILDVIVYDNPSTQDEIAEKLGGGGHEFASGISVKNKDEAKRVLMALDELLKNKKKN